MSEGRKYAYMINFEGQMKMGIIYHLNRYCVVRFLTKGTGMLTYTLRQYKTLSGAERFLLRDYPVTQRNAPEILYGTEKFIKEGKYWKED